MYLAKIIVKFKKNVKNPEAQTLETLVSRLQIENISSINCAKFYEIKIDAKNLEDAQKIAEKLAQNILSNPIIEEFEVQITNEP